MIPLMEPQMKAIERGPSCFERRVMLALILKLHQEVFPMEVGDKKVSRRKPQTNLDGSRNQSRRRGPTWSHYLDDNREAAEPLNILLHILRDCDSAEALVWPVGGKTNGLVLHASCGP